MKSRCFLTSFLMLLIGCNSPPTPSTTQTASGSAKASPTLSPSASESSASPIPKTSSKPLSASASVSPSSSDTTISSQGIGLAKVGMRLGQLKQLLAGKAEFKIQSPFIVDFDAIAVSQGGEEQFYILYPAQSPLADSDVIEVLVTDHPKYRTAEGVGSGTLIQQAEAVYGDATLFYNTQNESREYVKFANLTSKAIAFRAKAPQGEQFAGIYPSSQTESKQTKNFHKTASIGLVEVYCRQNCPPSSP